MKVRTKLLIDIEVDLDDNESTEETLRFLVDEDLSNKGYNVISTKLAEEPWILCSEREPDEDGMYLIKNKYHLTGEYHTSGKWKGKWTTDDTSGYEWEIYVTEWKVI